MQIHVVSERLYIGLQMHCIFLFYFYSFFLLEFNLIFSFLNFGKTFYLVQKALNMSKSFKFMLNKLEDQLILIFYPYFRHDRLSLLTSQSSPRIFTMILVDASVIQWGRVETRTYVSVIPPLLVQYKQY